MCTCNAIRGGGYEIDWAFSIVFCEVGKLN